MRRIIILAIACLTVSAVLADEYVFTIGFRDGHDWIAATEAGKIIYVTGVIDGLDMALLTGADSERIVRFYKCSSDMTVAQIKAIVQKYLDQHPETWDRPMSALMFTAITTSCPTS